MLIRCMIFASWTAAIVGFAGCQERQPPPTIARSDLSATCARADTAASRDSLTLAGGALRAQRVRMAMDSLDQAVKASWASLGTEGECEGSACSIALNTAPIFTFLKGHTESPVADSAARRALTVYAYFDSIPDLRTWNDGSGDNEDAALERLVASLDSTGRLLPPPSGTRLLERAGELWDRDGHPDNARSAFRAARDKAPPSVRACLDARLALLPARSFTLEPARVIGAHHVELRWHPPADSITAFVVYRSANRTAPGSAVARLPSTVNAWTDSTTVAGSMYWYQIVAETPGASVPSVAASAETPTMKFFERSAALSTTEHRLYLFGELSNGFPQVVAIPEDGSSVEQRDGVRIGLDALNPYIDDIWLADSHGNGVLHFRGTGGTPPLDLFQIVRTDRDFLRAELSPTSHGARDRFGAMMVSVDEPRGAAWVESGGGGSRPFAMDCVATPSMCWLEYDTQVVLRDEAGNAIAAAPLPVAVINNDGAVEPVGGSGAVGRAGGGLVGDPRDSSVWVVICGGEVSVDARCSHRPPQLLHIDRAGTVQTSFTLPQASTVLLARHERPNAWFTRASSHGGTELVQIDLGAFDPSPRVAARALSGSESFLSGSWIPDGLGGLWIVGEHSVRRIDGNGRQQFVIRLPGH